MIQKNRQYDLVSSYLVFHLLYFQSQTCLLPNLLSSVSPSEPKLSSGHCGDGLELRTFLPQLEKPGQTEPPGHYSRGSRPGDEKNRADGNKLHFQIKSVMTLNTKEELLTALQVGPAPCPIPCLGRFSMMLEGEKELERDLSFHLHSAVL